MLFLGFYKLLPFNGSVIVIWWRRCRISTLASRLLTVPITAGTSGSIIRIFTTSGSRIILICTVLSGIGLLKSNSAFRSRALTIAGRRSVPVIGLGYGSWGSRPRPRLRHYPVGILYLSLWLPKFLHLVRFHGRRFLLLWLLNFYIHFAPFY